MNMKAERLKEDKVVTGGGRGEEETPDTQTKLCRCRLELQ